MVSDDRRHLRQLDPLGDTYDLGREGPVQGATAAQAAVGTMLDDRVGIVADRPAMAFMPGLGPAGLRLLPPLLAVSRWRLRGGARGFVRTLQPQHQFDQLLAAQPLKIDTTHPTKESAKPNPRKGVRNYNPHAPFQSKAAGLLQRFS